MAGFYKEKKQDKLILKIEGELNIQSAENLKSELQNALKETKELIIDLDKVTDFDVTALQLLKSAVKSSETEKKKTTFTGDNLAVFYSALQASGFSRHFQM